MSDELNDDYDSPWKEALDEFFEHFIQFFFPAMHAAIDWSRGVEFLDKEFQQFVRDGERGRRTADKLVKVWLKSGEQQCVLVHAELQGQPQKDFAERLYVYNYSIYDHYRIPVASMAILLDESDGAWCTASFGYTVFGCKIQFEFPVVTLDAYRQSTRLLEQSSNPIALLVLAHLKTQESRRDYDRRLLSKLELVKILLNSGHPADTVRKLLRLMEWLLYLPDKYKQLYRDELQHIKEASIMPFVDTLQEIAIEKGIEKGMEKGLEKGLERGLKVGLEKGRLAGLQDMILANLSERFGSVPDSLSNTITGLTDFSELRRLTNASITAPTLKEFEGQVSNR